MKRSKKPAPKESKRKRQSNNSTKQPLKTVSHPLYGEIPLRPQTTVYAGKTQTYWTYDLSYHPPLPPGAVRGDIAKQIYCSVCHTPQFFYLDQEKTCVQCEQSFIFSAKEQKYWYETLQFNFHSTAIRCLKCRRQKRSGKALQTQLTQASQLLQAQPSDPLVQLNYAESLVRYYQHFQAGQLEKAVAACRQARRLTDQLPLSYFWEGEAQRLQGHKTKALAAYQAFVERSPAKPKRPRRLIQQARDYLQAANIEGSFKEMG